MHDDDHHRGFARDLATFRARFTSRRQILRLLGAASLVPLIGCTSDDAATGDDEPTIDATDDGTCTTIPSETAGPYPGDGSNGANVLTIAGVVRSDIRTSIGTASGTAAGVPLTVTLTLVSSGSSCAPLAGHAIYLWHCDRDGAYSMYSGTASAQNYLRGVQETDADGKVTFTTIVPACYSGRWPHMHFEIYQSLASATAGANALHTSQLAMPEAVCDVVFATTGYEDSVGNLAQVSLDSDNVFSDDGAAQQMAAVTGSVAGGYAATLTVAVD